MSVDPTLLTSSYDNVDRTSYTTASISPTANRWIVLDVISLMGIGDEPAVPSVSGLSLTWNQEITVQGSVTARRMTRFYAWSGSSPGSGAVTLSFGAISQQGCAWIINELGVDADTSDPFVQSVAEVPSTAGTSISVTLAAYGSSNNRPLVVAFHNTNEVSTPEAGYTEIADVAGSTPLLGLAVAFHSTTADTSPSYSWSSSASARIAIASEIKAAGGGTDLVVQDATHSHPADNVVLTQVHNLAVSDALHSHVADTVDLGPEITDPSDIAGLAEWWDPDDIAVADGAEVVTWTGNNGIVLTGPVGARPILRDGTRQPSGHKTAMYSGSKRMTAADAALNNAETTICVMYCPISAEIGAHRWVFNKLNSGNASTLAIRFDGANNVVIATLRLEGSESTGHSVTASSFINEGKPIVFVLRYDGTTASLRANGSEIASLSISGAIDVDTPGDFVLGNHPSSFTSNNGYIGDVVVYNNAIGLGDLVSLEAWMMDRWNIADYYDDWTTTIPATDQAIILGSDINSPVLRELDASTWIMFVCIGFAQIDYFTAPKSNPHNNWTRNPNGVIIDAAVHSPTTCRGVGAIKVGSTWHILVDNTGDFYYFSGTDLQALTDHGPVFAGQGTGWETFVRHPCIAETQINGKWPVFYDGRDQSAASGIGALGVVFWDFATFTDRQQALDVSPLWWERTDVGAPSAWFRNGQWELIYSGYNTDVEAGAEEFPHHTGLARSPTGLPPYTRVEVPIVAPARDGIRNWSAGGSELWDDGTDLHILVVGGPGEGIYSLQLGEAFSEGGTNLVIQDATHSHSADNVTLTQVHQLAIQDAGHAHSADNIVLTSETVLVVSDGAHAHTADNVSLTQAHQLVVQDATHSHSADNLVLPSWTPVRRRELVAVSRRGA